MNFRKNDNLFQKLENGKWITVHTFAEPIRGFWIKQSPDGECIMLCTDVTDTENHSHVYRFDMDGKLQCQIEAPPPRNLLRSEYTLLPLIAAALRTVN